MTTRPDTLQGSLPLLVLNVLARRGPLHGYAITSRIQELSDVLRVEEARCIRRCIAWRSGLDQGANDHDGAQSPCPCIRDHSRRTATARGRARALAIDHHRGQSRAQARVEADACRGCRAWRMRSGGPAWIVRSTTRPPFISSAGSMSSSLQGCPPRKPRLRPSAHWESSPSPRTEPRRQTVPLARPVSPGHRTGSACRRARAPRRSGRHGHCDSVAGPGHRCQHRDLFPRQQPAAPHAAGF